MALSELTEQSAILDAISEYDELGQDAFLAKYGSRPQLVTDWSTAANNMTRRRLLASLSRASSLSAAPCEAMSFQAARQPSCLCWSASDFKWKAHRQQAVKISG